MKNRTFFIETYGCQMNVADSTRLANLLVQKGFIRKTEFSEKVGAVIINTCSVRHSAENRIYGRLGHYKNLKQKKNFTLIVMGCMAEKEKSALLKSAPHVDYVIGTHYENIIPEILTNPVPESVHTGFEDYTFTPPAPDEKFAFRAFVSIIHGCSNYCSYCIVPYVRGNEISRPPHEILTDIKSLVQAGVKEIVLLGQNVNSYGIDSGFISFGELLKRVDNINGLERLRFVTSHPKDFTFELIDILANLKTLCKDIHLPLQSASDKVLKLMSRGYSFDDYFKKIEYLNKKLDTPRITTDLLVGFPGEDENDYLKTINAVKKIRYDNAFMYKYSPRRGTKAFEIEESISSQEKQNRLANLIKIQNNITKEKLKLRVNSVQDVLIESVSKQSENELKGISGNGYAVVFNASNSKPGQIVKVKITGVQGQTLKGKLI